MTDPYPRIAAAGLAEFLGWGTLQYSTNGTTWTTDVSFGRVIYPGAGQWTPDDPKLRVDSPSDWDAASKGGSASITGREARVSSNFSGIVRTNSPRSSGRRVFGLRLSVVNPPQTFFGGLAALSGWGSYNVGKHWLMYGADNNFYYYPTGTIIALSPAPGAPTVVGDTAYFDVDLGTGYVAIKKNAGAWSAPVLLPNFVLGADYIIDLLSPSTSGAQAGAVLLTTAAELGSAIPSGATAWDLELGTNLFAESVFTASAPRSLLSAASSPVPASVTTRSRVQLARDAEFGGAGRIWGTTKTKGAPNTPTKARVVLHHQRSKLPVRETWSDPVTGVFEFTGIDTSQQFLTLAEDAAGNFRPVAANKLTPEVLP
ncbi:hypothetical protein IB236_08595 [Acidovorax sp. ACV02]|uniref:hypothetical protein n=1 Tax=Acidovorax sp. ACV02 TaxID=2769310 RepID=UPI001991988E|nr:hypothetical protein [Acidovorax sp. ACV02]